MGYRVARACALADEDAFGESPRSFARLRVTDGHSTSIKISYEEHSAQILTGARLRFIVPTVVIEQFLCTCWVWYHNSCCFCRLYIANALGRRLRP